MPDEWRHVSTRCFFVLIFGPGRVPSQRGFWVNQQDLREDGRAKATRCPSAPPLWTFLQPRCWTTTSTGPSRSHRHLFIRVFGKSDLHSIEGAEKQRQKGLQKNTHLPMNKHSTGSFKGVFSHYFPRHSGNL